MSLFCFVLLQKVYLFPIGVKKSDNDTVCRQPSLRFCLGSQARIPPVPGRQAPPLMLSKLLGACSVTRGWLTFLFTVLFFFFFKWVRETVGLWKMAEGILCYGYKTNIISHQFRTLCEVGNKRTQVH